LRKTGFSKDGKHQCPQIFLGWLVGFGANPIGYDVFEGNISEGHTIISFGLLNAPFEWTRVIWEYVLSIID
jgi:hypothetical protein